MWTVHSRGPPGGGLQASSEGRRGAPHSSSSSERHAAVSQALWKWFLRNNMSECGGLTITLSEGRRSPCHKNTLSCFGRTPRKIRLHVFPPGRVCALPSPLFVKANMFLPARGSLVLQGRGGNPMPQLNGLR